MSVFVTAVSHVFSCMCREISYPSSWWKEEFTWPLNWVLELSLWPLTKHTTRAPGTASPCRGTNAKVTLWHVFKLVFVCWRVEFVIRVCSAGHLSVMAAENPSEREVMEGESPGSASDLNRSDLDPIYIGGLPASRPIRYAWAHVKNHTSHVVCETEDVNYFCRRQVVARSFVGCMKNVEIARTNFDLLRESYGVKKGCVLKVITQHDSRWRRRQLTSPYNTEWTKNTLNINQFNKIIYIKIKYNNNTIYTYYIIKCKYKLIYFIYIIYIFIKYTK